MGNHQPVIYAVTFIGGKEFAATLLAHNTHHFLQPLIAAHASHYENLGKGIRLTTG